MREITDSTAVYYNNYDDLFNGLYSYRGLYNPYALWSY